MQTLKSYLPHLFLALVSLFLLSMASDSKKEFEKSRGTIICQQLTNPTTRELTTAEMLTVADILTGMAAVRGLPVSVILNGKLLEMSTTDNQGTLARYPALMSFLSAISYLPWDISYETFCLGQRCERSVISAKLKVNTTH